MTTESLTKYPRTPHVPFSMGRTSDDKVLRDLKHFEHKEIVVTMKMDGENSSLYRHAMHARSLNSRHHPARDWLAHFHGNIAHLIPDGWRICAENMYARHSIPYTCLKSYLLGFSVWDDSNSALAWDHTLEFFEQLNITPVQTLYRGVFDEQTVKALVANLDLNQDEGLVIRLADRFHYDDFGRAVAKWVRKGHVQTDKHWMHGPITPNGLLTS